MNSSNFPTFLAAAALVLAIVALVRSSTAKNVATNSVQKLGGTNRFNFCTNLSGGSCTTGVFDNLVTPEDNDIKRFDYVISEPSYCNLSMTQGTFGRVTILKIYNPSVVGCGNASVTFLDSQGLLSTATILPDGVQEFLATPNTATQQDYTFLLGNYTQGIVSLTQFGSLSM